MKRVATLLNLLFIGIILTAQIPQGFNYQAIARDSKGNPITNATIKIKLSVLTDTSGFFLNGTGTYLWEEEQTDVKTNAFGLITVVFGNPLATKIQGSAASFSAINWSISPLFIGTKIANPTLYMNLGTAKLWAVPYSLNSAKADLSTNSSTAATVTNGVYTTGSYTDPAWITSLAGNKITGTVASATNAITVSNGVYTTGTYSDPAWITSLAGTKISGKVSSATNAIIADTAKAIRNGSKMSVVSVNDDSSEPLFEVKRKDGQTVFAVYPNAVNIYVPRVTPKGVKGGFAIGGFDGTKINPQDYLRVTPDSIRIYIDKTPNISKGTTKGGFAIGGFDQTKDTKPQDLLTVSNDSIRMYINDLPGKGATKGGFAIGGLDNSKGKGPEYIRITEDSTRINMKEAAKGTKGGFAIGGFDQGKGTVTSFTSLSPENYFIGHEAGMSNTTGRFNSFLGYHAGRSNTIGDNNIFIGRKSGYSNTDGWWNLFIGDSAGYNNTSGYANLYLGTGSGQNNTSGWFNASLGQLAGSSNTSGFQNINLGYMAGYSNTTGFKNICIGAGAAQNDSTGQANVMIGNLAGAASFNGSHNVYIGAYAGRYDTTGSYNVFIGNYAGNQEKSSYKLHISVGANWPLIYGDFQYQTVVIAGNKANPFERTFFVNGDAGGMYAWSNDSDRKLKHDIVTIPDALQKVMKLRGVNFLWNEPKDNMAGLQMGFIGQEAADVIPEVVSVKNDHYSMQYAPVTALLVEGMKEQQKQIESQKKEIEELKALVNSLIANQTGNDNK
jgi:trimeric autotransporter adhesin